MIIDLQLPIISILLLDDASLQHLRQVVLKVIGVVGVELAEFAHVFFAVFLHLAERDVVVVALVQARRSPRVHLSASIRSVRGWCVIKSVEVGEVSVKVEARRVFFGVESCRSAERIEAVVVFVVVSIVAVSFGEGSAGEWIDGVVESELVAEEIGNFFFCFR